jgi:hypothetical protein
MSIVGRRVAKVIERLMDWRSPDLKLVCLKGNHEEHHVAVLPSANQGWMVGWIMVAGATLISYGQNYGDIVNVKVVPEMRILIPVRQCSPTIQKWRTSRQVVAFSIDRTFP